MKVDMAKVLLREKNQEEAKKISIKIFTIHNDLKRSFIELYISYIRHIFAIKFFSWRRKKLIYQGKPSSFEWEGTIATLLKEAKENERYLFEGLNQSAEVIFISSAAKNKNGGPLQTKLSFRHLKWTKHIP